MLLLLLSQFPHLEDSLSKFLPKQRVVEVAERVKMDDEGYFYLNSFSTIKNAFSKDPKKAEALVGGYMRYLLGKAKEGDREKYVEMVNLASGGREEVKDFLLNGCRKGHHLTREWKEVVDRAVDSLIAYSLDRSKPLKGIYYGPALDGTTYAFRGLFRSRDVAWGSPPILMAEALEHYPFTAAFLLSVGDAAFNMPSIALAYGRLEGSQPQARFVVKHLFAGRFASLTEYDPAPYEPCLPESLYLAVAHHPKVIAIMVAHSFVDGKPASLNDSLLSSLSSEKPFIPDWLNMGAIRAYYFFTSNEPFNEWLDSSTKMYPSTPPYDFGRNWELLEVAEDLWNSPALLSMYFASIVAAHRGYSRPKGGLKELFVALEKDEAFWQVVRRIEEEAGWINIYNYALERAEELLMKAAKGP